MDLSSTLEWTKVPGGKIPYTIQMKDGLPFAFAGLWEGWKPPENGDWIRTCTIITGEPIACTWDRYGSK
jgi:putative SOS response-associated peptidase YedK